MNKKYILLLFVVFLVLFGIVSFASMNINKELEQTERMLDETISKMEILYQETERNLYELDHIYRTAEEYGVPPEVVVAIMRVESNFNPNLESGCCYGIMQIHGNHCKSWGIETEQLFNLKSNTKIGISLLSGLQEESNNMYEVLGKYNMGSGGYAKYCRETGETVTRYADKVMSIVEKWENNSKSE